MRSYLIQYKYIDHDAEEMSQRFTRWAEAAKFIKSLLDDGYEIVGVFG